MDLEHKRQVRQIKKVFIGSFLFCISLLFLFFIYILIKSEYNENIVYGQIKKGKIANSYWTNESIESPTSKQFNCKIIIDRKIFDYIIQNADQSYAISKEEDLLIQNISIGDSVKVKILNEKQVKILEWRKKIINDKNDTWGIIQIWILIITLTIIYFFLQIKIYKIYK